MATYVIGDIQGCLDPLERLLRKVRFDPEHDALWCVGDLVNRGPHSAAVLRRIKGLGSAALVVLGNHDLRLLAVAEGCADVRRKDTFHDVLAAPDRDDLVHWLRHRPLLHQHGRFLLVHGGLLPSWSTAEAAMLAREVEAALRGRACKALLQGLVSPDCGQWSDSLIGADRVRVAANVLTRLRICSADGSVAWSFTGPLASVPEGYFPWFHAPGRRSTDAYILFGHWAALGLWREENLVGLDSGCVWRRHLSAFRLDDHQVIQVSCES